MNGFHRLVRVDGDDPLRLPALNRHKSIEDPLVERLLFALKAVFVLIGIFGLFEVAAAGSGDAGSEIGDHQKREVGLKIVAERAMKLQHNVAAQFASATLVGFAGVGEAVAKHPLSPVERRQYLFLNVLHAVGKHESQLRHRSKAGGAGAEQDGAQPFANRGAAGFAAGDYVQTAFAKVDREFFKLRALAHSVKAFKGDKFAARLV